MGYVKPRITARREHETPRRLRFRGLIEQGYSQRHAAQVLNLSRGTASKWLSKTDRRTKRPGRPPIISDKKVEEIVNWMTGHFHRRALPLQEIAYIYGITDATNKTILAAFARHGYHYYVPDCKPFLSDKTRSKR